MTDKGPGSSSEWVDGDILTADDQLDSMANLRFRSILYDTNDAFGIVKHSSTNYSKTDTSGNIRLSTDTGATWAAAGGTHALDAENLIRVAKDDITKGIAIEVTGNYETAYTSDSGANWNATTVATFGTVINDVSFPTNNLIVVGGDDAAGTDHVIFSTDQAATWTNATTSPSVRVAALDMFDGTTGYAVDTSNNIWKTTNSAVDWTDTTDNVTVDSLTSIYAVTADILLIWNGTSGTLSRYVNSTNTVSTIYVHGNVTAGSGGIVKTTVGHYFFALFPTTGAALNAPVWLLRSSDSGVSIDKIFSYPGGVLTSPTIQASAKSGFSEFQTDQIAIGAGKPRLIIVPSED